MTAATKRKHGRFYTAASPFALAPFGEWATMARMKNAEVLEPFAGANNLITMLRAGGMCGKFASFDIAPNAAEVRKRDTLKDFPRGYSVCVTNPPWLAKNAATRMGFEFPRAGYDDLYKVALAKCLENCGYVAAIVPESFIRSGLFHNRLLSFVSLTREMFADTDHPAALSLFVPEGETRGDSPRIHANGKFIGGYKKLSRYLPPAAAANSEVRFNAPDGNVGLRALDGTKTASIRFCRADELDGYNITHSSRAITKIKIKGEPKIGQYNKALAELRAKTHDVFLTAFRGLRTDGKYRRRLDYALARDIVCNAA